MFKEFRAFIMRGNVIELAVAVVMGVAFKAVVDSLVADIIMPIIAALVGKPDFSSLTFTVNGSVFTYGNFINAIIAFLAVAVGVFFLIVKPANFAAKRAARGEKPADPTVKVCPQCLSEVPIAATRCKFCAQPILPA